MYPESERKININITKHEPYETQNSWSIGMPPPRQKLCFYKAVQHLKRQNIMTRRSDLALNTKELTFLISQSDSSLQYFLCISASLDPFIKWNISPCGRTMHTKNTKFDTHSSVISVVQIFRMIKFLGHIFIKRD